MTIPAFVLSLLLIFLSYLLAIKTTRGKWKMVGALLVTGIWGGIIVFGFSYTTSHALRLAIDARVSPDSHHINLSNGQKLPLPGKTTLSFRTSEKTATYFTPKSEQEIINYYANELPNDQSLPLEVRNKIEVAHHSETPHQFIVTWYGQTYKIMIMRSEKPSGNYLQISSE